MKIGLMQINNDFGGACYLPYSVGCLQAYAQKQLPHRTDLDFLPPLFRRMPVDDAVAELISADIVCASLYVWNKEMSYEILRRLKERKPSVVTVVGGPQVPNHLESYPDRVRDYLDAHPFIDIACHGEGERAFSLLLDHWQNDWSHIPSISYKTSDGVFVRNELAPRLLPKEIDEAPSPYLAGIFESLMAAYPERQWLVLWETDRGCPFSCTFCDWGSLVNAKVFKFNLARLFQELEWVAEHKIEFMFCANANFAIFDRDVEIAKYAAETKAKYGYPKALSVQNAKNAADRVFQAQYILAQAGLNKGVTLAFQSRDPQTLKDIKRANIADEEFRRLQKLFTEHDMETYSDMIIGLPGESYDSFVTGVSRTITDGQHNRIQFGNLSILPNAEMGDPAYLERFGMKTMKVRAVTYHGSVYEPEWEVSEHEELVTETASMPCEEWMRTRAFAWMTALLHFDKILQLPLIVAKEICGVTYRELIEVFSECSSENYPTILEIKNFFLEKARSIQRGEVEYCTGPDRLNIWWPADEFIFIKLVREEKLGKFYAEAEQALCEFLAPKRPNIKSILRDALLLNQCLIKLPFEKQNIHVAISHNILEFCKSIRIMKPIELVHESSTYTIDKTTERWSSWDEWMQKVVWWGNKKGAYLYGNLLRQPAEEKEIGGHY